MNVRLGSFAKKKNSTAVPSGGLVTTITGALRDGCSVERPMIGFAADRMTSPVRYNYAFVVEFARYYFIQDWEWYKGLWWAHMEVDPMATYKTQIGASSCYVLRAANQRDITITDGLYPSKSISYGYSPAEYEEIWDTDALSGGTYIVGVIGKGDSGVGAVNYYALTASEMNSFRSQLLSNIGDVVGITEITNELLKALFNPFQYVVSCTWFPISYSEISGSAASQINLGWWTINASGKVVSNFTVKIPSTGTGHIEAKAPTQAYSDGGGYRLSAPYTSYTLVFPPFGEITLDAQVIAEKLNEALPVSDSVNLEYAIRVDLISGNGYLELWCGDYMMTFCEGKIGVPTQLGQITQNIGGALQSGAEAVASYGSGNAALAVVGTLGGIISGTQNYLPRATTKGLNAGITVFHYGAYVTSKYNPPVPQSNEENGQPLCQTKVISTLPGYVKTMNCDIVITGATDTEQEKVRGIMNGGFFYE